MGLRVVGAGVGRTGTASLKLALERLLGRPCYHMLEVFEHPEHVGLWQRAAEGQPPDWHELLAEYESAVDWPAAAFWPELAAAFPDALVLLSVRDPESWWRSASETIFSFDDADFEGAELIEMIRALMRSRFTEAVHDRAQAITAFEQHNARVRATVPPDRLLEWSPGDGWEPLCAALGVAVPAEPFPHVNTRPEFQAQVREAAPALLDRTGRG